MVETTLSRLAGERVRYHDDTWELTGDVTIRRNGEVINATAVQDGRGRNAQLRFEIQNKPRSMNPGNLESLNVDLKRDENGPMLLLHRHNGTDRYRLDAMTYS